MEENVHISDSEDSPKSSVEVKNENIFLKGAKTHTEIPAIKVTSLILVLLSFTMTLMFLYNLRNNSSPPVNSEKGTQIENKEKTKEP